MIETMIDVSGLKKSYKANHVLKDVSFTVRKGSVFALLGSNGAGKTTVVKILSTLMKSDSGKATINGFDVVRQGYYVRECISLTGQFTAVDEVLTGRENLNLIGQLKRLNNVKNKVNEWLSFFHLQDAAESKVCTWSGGMRRRLEVAGSLMGKHRPATVWRRRLDLAMSLMGKPQIIFLDEPTTGLDPQNRIAMWDLVKELAAGGTTVFLTTQYLEEAEYLADYIAILHGGKILAEGTPQYLKTIMPQRGAQLNFQSEEQASEAMALLNENGITIDSFEQKLPSLEEVFLALTDEKGGK